MKEKLREKFGEETFKEIMEVFGGEDKEIFVNDGSFFPKHKFDDLNNDKKELKKQLDDVNAKLQELSNVDVESFKKEIEDLKSKYETDTNALNEKISKREYEYAVNDLTRDLKFSSESAKKSFMSDLLEKNLKLEDGKLFGFDDYLNSYKEQDPNAFIVEKQGEDIKLGDNHSGVPTNDDSFERKVMGL